MITDIFVILSTSIFYIKAYLSVRNVAKKAKQKETVSASLAARKTANNAQSRSYTLAKAIMCILIAKIICYAPYFIVGTVSLYQLHVTHITPSVDLTMKLLWSLLMAYSISFWNVIIFTIFNPGIKKLVLPCFSNKVESIQIAAIQEQEIRNWKIYQCYIICQISRHYPVSSEQKQTTKPKPYLAKKRSLAETKLGHLRCRPHETCMYSFQNLA